MGANLMVRYLKLILILNFPLKLIATNVQILSCKQQINTFRKFIFKSEIEDWWSSNIDFFLFEILKFPPLIINTVVICLLNITFSYCTVIALVWTKASFLWFCLGSQKDLMIKKDRKVHFQTEDTWFLMLSSCKSCICECWILSNISGCWRTKAEYN